MVYDKFHTYRNDSVAREERKQTSRRETTDTLVELVPLIEQGDLHANGSRYDKWAATEVSVRPDPSGRIVTV